MSDKLEKELEKLRDENATLKANQQKQNKLLEEFDKMGVKSVDDLKSVIQDFLQKNQQQPTKAKKETNSLERQVKSLTMERDLEKLLAKHPEDFQFFRKNPDALANAIALYDRVLEAGDDVTAAQLLDYAEKDNQAQHEKWSEVLSKEQEGEGKKEAGNLEDGEKEKEGEEGEKKEDGEKEGEEGEKKDKPKSVLDQLKEETGYDPRDDKNLPSNIENHRIKKPVETNSNKKFNPNRIKSTGNAIDDYLKSSASAKTAESVLDKASK